MCETTDFYYPHVQSWGEVFHEEQWNTANIKNSGPKYQQVLPESIRELQSFQSLKLLRNMQLNLLSQAVAM